MVRFQQHSRAQASPAESTKAAPCTNTISFSSLEIFQQLRDVRVQRTRPLKKYKKNGEGFLPKFMQIIGVIACFKLKVKMIDSR
ncbi:hypothetical protein CEXT_681531 [Caerostris extrusa]|uniref:Uncharacterized protein n=1 Tax=Caerostris extrusa TaxID=172846 RepID=A0AAV4QJP9_CAEEX|nr:hypothetical protein CEXT_681531 [Caerostris extrusa]